MRIASWFEIVAARCWNVLNEGKSFHPLFSLGVFLLGLLATPEAPSRFLAGLLFALPALAVNIRWDFPLHLRWFLWPPVAAALLWLGPPDAWLLALGLALYFFFTIILWGTIYYHLRTGTPWTNFTRFWKLVLKNADSTSGNAQEQVPKFVLALALLQGGTVAPLGAPAGPGAPGVWAHLAGGWLFAAALAGYAWAVHRWLFTWRPAEYTGRTGC